ncbi:MerR family transcriptional regulator [Levilactobacillus parabrevis]|uniref:MerR family transcriptional regulator n=1 Tax=Levilactobacillus parabrevis TaxID=357278 RepID=UPI0021A44398|nr:MerR family transcriptional regulator [Levilactobacillus parabrevis]MCT4487979.1 MerR family transcriptional regulator [Levilactobacillus parabrevis]MCT4490413.1 MerR family transcriptional regulator [Levilactobacillus parabrevis]
MTELTISEVAKQYDLAPSTLRYYERLGLIPNVQQKGNHRVYNEANLEKLNSIVCFKNSGMRMSELQELLSYRETGADLDKILTILNEHEVEVARQLAKLEKYHRHITQKVAFYSAIKQAEIAGEPRPDWADYKPEDEA